MRVQLRFAVVVSSSLLAGCGGGTTEPPPPPPPPPPPAPTITLNPTTLNLLVGESQTITATVNNGTGTVTWSTSAPAIATVDQTGRVSGVTAGDANITATLSGTSVTATATARVTAPPISVDVLGVTQGGQAANLGDLKGTVTFRLSVQVPAGFAGRAEVLFGAKVAGSIPVTAPAASGPATVSAAAPVEVGVPVSTLSAESISPTGPTSVADLILKLPNGPYQAGARLVATGQAGQGEQVVATVPTATSVTVNNTGMAAVVSLVPELTATNDATGQVWGGGNLTIQMKLLDPVANRTTTTVGFGVEQIEVLTGGAATIGTYGSDAVAGVVNFILDKTKTPAAGGSLGLTGDLRLRDIQAQTSAGPVTGVTILNDQPGYGFAFKGTTRYDNAPPSGDPTKFTFGAGLSIGWLNQNDLISDRLDRIGFTVTDPGVGGVTCSYHCSTSTSFTNPTQITKGGDFGAEVAPSFYLRATCKDKLNLSVSYTLNDGSGNFQRIGTDFGNPTLSFADQVGSEVGIRDFAWNPTVGAAYLWTGADGRSGLASPEPYRFRMTRDAPGVTDQCAVGTVTGTDCMPIRLATGRYVPSLTQFGEYYAEAKAFDRAWNRSSYAGRRTIFDPALPALDNFTVPAALSAGVAADFRVQLSDNLEIGYSAIAFRFAGLNLPVVLAERPEGVPYDGQYQLTVDRTFTLKAPLFYETTKLGPSSFYIPEGTARRATHAIGGGADAAGNVIQQAVDISARLTGNPVSFSGSGLDRWDVSLNAAQLCWNPYGTEGDCGGRPETAILRSTLYYPAGSQARISEMFLGKQVNFSGQDVLAKLDLATSLNRANFGGFFTDDAVTTVRGTDLMPGSYQLFHLGSDGAGGYIQGPSRSLQVVPAVRITFGPSR